MADTICCAALLNRREGEEIQSLLEEVNRHDGTGYTFDPEDDFRKEGEFNSFLLYRQDRLVSAINLFTPQSTEAEITAFTHPDFRRRGFFTSLRLTMEEELRRRGIPSQLFVCDRRFHPGKEILHSLGAVYEFSEYMMKLSGPVPPEPEISGMILAPADPEELPLLAKIMSEAFGDPLEEAETRAAEFFGSEKRTLHTIRLGGVTVGMIGVYREGRVDYLHGFCLAASHRGRGLGKAALIRTVRLCRDADPSREIRLEVQTDNENALNLYLQSGFSPAGAFDYHRRQNPADPPRETPGD